MVNFGLSSSSARMLKLIRTRCDGSSKAPLTKADKKELHAWVKGMGGIPAVAAAVERMLANGWAGAGEENDASVLERYRKSEARQKVAEPVFPWVSPDVNTGGGHTNREVGFLLDHETREGQPVGPTWCPNEDALMGNYAIQAWCSAMTTSAAFAYANDPDFRCHENPETGQRYTLQEQTATIRARLYRDKPDEDWQAMGLDPLPPQLVDHMNGLLIWKLLTPGRVKKLKEITVDIPLDASDEAIACGVRDIISEWRARRLELGFIPPPSRSRIDAKRANLRGLPTRLREILFPYTTFNVGASSKVSSAAAELALEHQEAAVESREANSVDRFVVALAASLRQRYPEIMVDEKWLSSAVRESFDSAQER